MADPPSTPASNVFGCRNTNEQGAHHTLSRSPPHAWADTPCQRRAWYAYRPRPSSSFPTTEALCHMLRTSLLEIRCPSCSRLSFPPLHECLTSRSSNSVTNLIRNVVLSVRINIIQLALIPGEDRYRTTKLSTPLTDE